LTLRAVVGLGANLGDRLATMRAAVELLKDESQILKTSHVYATAPVGLVNQPDFLNAAALVRCEMAPEGLLDILLRIESRLGRLRREKWGPRVIDLDLLWGEGVAANGPRLTLPHPHLTERAFALVPMLELAPDAADPMTGARYVAPLGDVWMTGDLL